LRSEKKFKDLDALKEQLKADKAEARAIISRLDE
jgi:FAD synthase